MKTLTTIESNTAYFTSGPPIPREQLFPDDPAEASALEAFNARDRAEIEARSRLIEVAATVAATHTLRPDGSTFMRLKDSSVLVWTPRNWSNPALYWLDCNGTRAEVNLADPHRQVMLAVWKGLAARETCGDAAIHETQSPQADDDGWIPWNGRPEASVVRLRDGCEHPAANDLRWSHTGSWSVIVAYKKFPLQSDNQH